MSDLKAMIEAGLPAGSELIQIIEPTHRLNFPEKPAKERLLQDTFSIRSAFQSNLMSGMLGHPEKAIIEAALQVLGTERGRLALESEGFMKLLEDESSAAADRKIQYLGLAAQCTISKNPVGAAIGITLSQVYEENVQSLLNKLITAPPIDTWTRLEIDWLVNIALAPAAVAPKKFSIWATEEEPDLVFAARVSHVVARVVEATEQMLQPPVDEPFIRSLMLRFSEARKVEESSRLRLPVSLIS